MYRGFVAGAIGVAILGVVLTQVLNGGPSPTDDVAVPTEPTSGPVATDSPEQAGEELLEPTAPAPPGTVIYEHDFSSPENGWLGGEASQTSSNVFGSRTSAYTDRGTLIVQAVAQVDQGYVAGGNSEGIVADGRELGDLGDVSLEVDVTPIRADGGAAWGLACRRDRVTGRFYYGFVIMADGSAQAGIVRQDTPGEGWQELARTDTTAITVGFGDSNRLRLDCIGTSIALYADGEKIVEVEDSTYASGSLALFANPFRTGDGPANPSLEVEFDDLVLREVGPAG